MEDHARAVAGAHSSSLTRLLRLGVGCSRSSCWLASSRSRRCSSGSACGRPPRTQMNKDAVQPYLHGKMTQGQAYDAGIKPLRTFMLKQTRKPELALFADGPDGKKPQDADHVGMAALVPAFVLSELKTAFIIGFIVFIPFLVIDLIVSSSLMSMGMMMLPPVLVSLPFKILLFVLVDGWSLIVKSLLTSFH